MFNSYKRIDNIIIFYSLLKNHIIPESLFSNFPYSTPLLFCG